VITVACGTSTRTMPKGIPTFAVNVSIAVDHMTLANGNGKPGPGNLLDRGLQPGNGKKPSRDTSEL